MLPLSAMVMRGRERKAVVQESAQPPDGRIKVAFLIADRNHDLDLGFSPGACSSTAPRGVRRMASVLCMIPIFGAMLYRSLAKFLRRP